MARMVRLEATASVKLDPKTLDPNKLVSLCACGLSQTFPLCDGAHKLAREREKPGVLSIYDKARKEIVREEPDGE